MLLLRAWGRPLVMKGQNGGDINLLSIGGTVCIVAMDKDWFAGVVVVAMRMWWAVGYWA